MLDKKKEKLSACLFFMDEETRLVLAVSRKYDPNDFGLPGGKKEPDETLEEAVVREVKEETGLEVHGVIPIFTSKVIDYQCTTFIPRFIKGEISTQEKGVVDLVEPRILTYGSFGSYNRALFNHIGLRW